MAVQKSRVTRSRVGMRRSHDKISKPTLSVDAETGENETEKSLVDQYASKYDKGGVQ